ncbi:hypothetical protein [Microscilla marina]|uniref:Uncharacterized protein n=1 Tax=Microscilla marina ATCC 23134 TaxID=313606 RepID=A1ZVE0_MICM2|nr:hypothetical protein [Microscilla marina]EAY25638.1 hypothetical protein M23134_07289 [Microscilla marina ATCC 23134]
MSFCARKSAIFGRVSGNYAGNNATGSYRMEEYRQTLKKVGEFQANEDSLWGILAGLEAKSTFWRISLFGLRFSD